MIYRLLIALILLSLYSSCDEKTNSGTSSKEHKAKSINFDEFSIVDISPKAQYGIQNWKSFQSLMQVIVSMAPTKIKNTEKLINATPDSLLIYTRLPIRGSKVLLNNASVDRDWRSNGNVKDTVYRFDKKKEEEYSFIQWNNFLVEGIPYTLSVFVKDLNAGHLSLEVSQESSKIVTEKFALYGFDSENSPMRKKRILEDDWKELQITFTPKKEGNYGVLLSFDEEVKGGNGLIFYRPTLQIPAKYFSKIGKFSDKIVKEQAVVESSYYSLYFWLIQIEEELKQLLLEDAFPEVIAMPAIKARFRLFETQIKELADNVKNNPDFNEEQIRSGIANMHHTFNSIILRINNFYESDLDDKMQQVNKQLDTIAPKGNDYSESDDSIM